MHTFKVTRWYTSEHMKPVFSATFSQVFFVFLFFFLSSSGQWICTLAIRWGFHSPRQFNGVWHIKEDGSVKQVNKISRILGEPQHGDLHLLMVAAWLGYFIYLKLKGYQLCSKSLK